MKMRSMSAWLITPALLLAVGCTDGSNTPQPSSSKPGSWTQPAPAPQESLLEGDDEASDPIGAGVSGARKGAGGFNGDGDFCDNGTCVATEGDCDSSAQCSDGSVCLSDNGGRYADLTGPRRNQQDDHCAPASCNDRDQLNDPLEIGVDCGGPCGLCQPACELPQHHAARCTYHCQCPSGIGDCDSNFDCVGWDNPVAAQRAVCVADVGARFGGPATNDYCLPAHCTNRVQDVALGEDVGIDAGGVCGSACPTGVPGTECTPSCPCGAGAGDCDTNLDCQPGLTCVEQGPVDTCQAPVQPVGLLYAVRETGDVLISIHPTTLAITAIGPLGVAFDFGELAWDPTTNTMYMVDGRGARGLYTVNLNTGAATLVGLHNVTDMFGLAVAGNGQLYGTADGTWYSINKLTGAATALGPTEGTFPSPTWDSTRGQMVAVSYPGTAWLINVANGAFTNLNVPNPQFIDNNGTGYDRDRDLLWSIGWSGRLYTHNPAAGYTQTLLLSNLGPHDGIEYVP